MATNLSGKCVLVMGGETPLGRAIAVGLAERGADVAIASLTNNTKAEFAINSALNELWAIGRRGLAIAIDASDLRQVTDAITQTQAELGTLHLVIALALEPATIALEDVKGAVLHVPPGNPPGAALAATIERLATT